MHLQELKAKSPADLLAYAEELEIENASTLRKQDMMFAILKQLADNEVAIYGSGVLEVLSDGFGFLRAPESNYLPGPDDIYVSPSQVRRFSLRTGDTVEGEIRAAEVFEHVAGEGEGQALATILGAARDRVPALLDIGLIGLLEPVGQPNHAVLQLGAFQIALAVERGPLPCRELAHAFDDRLDKVGLGGGEVFMLGQFGDAGIGTNGEQLVLRGGLVGGHLAHILLEFLRPGYSARRWTANTLRNG